MQTSLIRFFFSKVKSLVWKEKLASQRLTLRKKNYSLSESVCKLNKIKLENSKNSLKYFDLTHI